MSYSRYNQWRDRPPSSGTWVQNERVPSDPAVIRSQPKSEMSYRWRLSDEQTSFGVGKKYETMEMDDFKSSTTRLPSGEIARSSSRHSTISGLSGNYAVDNRPQQSYREFNGNQKNSIFHYDSQADHIGDDTVANGHAKDKKRTATGIGCCQKSTLDPLETENQWLKKELVIREEQIQSLTTRTQFFEQEFQKNQQRFEELVSFVQSNRNLDVHKSGDFGLGQTERNEQGNRLSCSYNQRTDKDLRSLDRGGRSLELENRDLQQNIGTLQTQLSQLEHVKTQLINEEKQKNEELKSRIHLFERQIKNLREENVEVTRRSDNITRQMALKTEGSGRFESVNDQFSNSNIAQMFNNLYDKEWVNLSRTLGRKLPQINEIQRIQILTAVLQRCYRECTKLADTQTRHMLLLADTENTENIYEREEFQDMLTHLRRYCQKETVRTIVKEKVLVNVMSSDEVRQLCKQDKSKTIRENLESYCNQLINGCWLIAISRPPIILNFDVVGQSFEDLEQTWKEYSTKHPIEDIDKTDGTIVAVVWPSVELKIGTGIFTKGYAIVVKRRRQRMYSQRNEDIVSSKYLTSSSLRNVESTF